MRKTLITVLTLIGGASFAEEMVSTGTESFVNYSLSFSDMLIKWAVLLGWILVASLGFAFGVGISIKVFDWLTKDINEWEEVKNKNWVVGLILMTLIVMIGLIILKLI